MRRWMYNPAGYALVNVSLVIYLARPFRGKIHSRHGGGSSSLSQSTRLLPSPSSTEEKSYQFRPVVGLVKHNCLISIRLEFTRAYLCNASACAATQSVLAPNSGEKVQKIVKKIRSNQTHVNQLSCSETWIGFQKHLPPDREPGFIVHIHRVFWLLWRVIC